MVLTVTTTTLMLAYSHTRASCTRISQTHELRLCKHCMSCSLALQPFISCCRSFVCYNFLGFIFKHTRTHTLYRYSHPTKISKSRNTSKERKQCASDRMH